MGLQSLAPLPLRPSEVISWGLEFAAPGELATPRSRPQRPNGGAVPAGRRNRPTGASASRRNHRY